MNPTLSYADYRPSEILVKPIGDHYRARILVTLGYAGCAVSLVYAVILWAVYDNSVSGLSDVLFALSYLFSLYWTQQKKYATAAYWIIFWGGLQVTLGSIFFVGPETGFQLYFLTLPVMIYFLLAQQTTWAKASTLLYGGLMFIASQTLSSEAYRTHIPSHLANLVFITNAFIVLAIIFFAMRFFCEELKRAYHDQSQLVLTDALTGLSNDRFVRQHAPKLVSMCERYGHPLSLIFLDIAGFRTLNQCYGRATGDQVLQLVAERLKQAVRDADIPARIGGDEFLVLLPETDPEQARLIAMRLQHSLQNDPVAISQQVHKLTINVGTSSCDSSSLPPLDQLISAAAARAS